MDKYLNIFFLIVGMTGGLYTLYSILLKNIRNEIQKMEKGIVLKLRDANH
jgi:hypothetical protein